MGIEEPVDEWEWLEDGEEWGYPLGFLCRSCFVWDDRSNCKECSGTGRIPVPFSEVWGAFDE